MNIVIIDNEFFNLSSSLSDGLISGLKKLSERDFKIKLKSSSSELDELLCKILESEGILLSNEPENLTNRIFYITQYKNSIERSNSIYVNSDSEINNFWKAASEVIKRLRSSSIKRKTKETDIEIEISLDGNGKSDIETGLGFFDHMLEQIARHGNVNLKIKVKGDLHVDEHHTVEDVGIALGNAISDALGNKKGIKRYGYFLPMDDSFAKCAIDLGGRAFLNFKCKFNREMVGEFPTELTEEFFRGLASGLKANIFLRAKGKNDHHKIEALFKSFAKSLNEACRLDERTENNLPSTKGIL